MKKLITEKELNKKLESFGYYFSHTAYAKGYESRTNKNYRVEQYNGKYGTGYIVHYPCYHSTRFHKIGYFLEKNGE